MDYIDAIESVTVTLTEEEREGAVDYYFIGGDLNCTVTSTWTTMKTIVSSTRGEPGGHWFARNSTTTSWVRRTYADLVLEPGEVSHLGSLSRDHKKLRGVSRVGPDERPSQKCALSSK